MQRVVVHLRKTFLFRHAAQAGLGQHPTITHAANEVRGEDKVSSRGEPCLLFPDPNSLGVQKVFPECMHRRCRLISSTEKSIMRAGGPESVSLNDDGVPGKPRLLQG